MLVRYCAIWADNTDRSGLWGRTGKRFIAIARNGEKVEGAPQDWPAEIDSIAKAVDWGNGDLFPELGMPTLS